MQGYIKLHRILLDNQISKKPQYVWLWITLLLLANHKQNKFIWNGETIIVGEGQFMTGRKQLSDKTGISESTVERILKYLENEHQIEQQKTTKFRLITIVNWKRYQQEDSRTNNKRTTDGQQADNKRTQTRMNKNVNNEKNDNKHYVCFEKFWNIYPKKISKKKAEQCWNKLKPSNALFEKIVKAIETAKKTDQWERGFIPHATTYLNQERWNDKFTNKDFEDNKNDIYDVLVIK